MFFRHSAFDVQRLKWLCFTTLVLFYHVAGSTRTLPGRHPPPGAPCVCGLDAQGTAESMTPGYFLSFRRIRVAKCRCKLTLLSGSLQI